MERKRNRGRGRQREEEAELEWHGNRKRAEYNFSEMEIGIERESVGKTELEYLPRKKRREWGTPNIVWRGKRGQNTARVAWKQRDSKREGVRGKRRHSLSG